MSTDNQVLQDSENKVPKWVWWVVVVLVLVAAVLAYLVYAQKNKSTSAAQSEEVVNEAKPTLETFRILIRALCLIMIPVR